VNVVTDNPIAPALKQFSHVTDDARVDVIYALRHALAHDYALFNANSKHPSRQHAFNFTADDDTPLVVLPRRAWNGSYNASTSIAPEETTVVKLRALGDLCEEVVANLRRLHERQRLGITMIAANRIKPTVHPLVSRAACDPDDEYDSLVIWQIPPLLCGRHR
jgi:hypothetical protein